MRIKRLITAFVLFLSLPVISHADELSDLRSEVEALSRKIRDMEDESASRFGWNLGVFGDVNYSTESRERRHDSFSIGNLTLYSTASYGDRLNFLLEIDFEPEEEEVDIERVWAGYRINDLLVIRGGKFHTALGYWNKTFHHGKQLFLTVDRPFFLAFEHEGGVLPTHITGLELEGGKTFGFGRLKYEFQLGNGPAIHEEEGEDEWMLDPNNTSDDNTSKQPILRVSLRPSAVQGLSVGISATTFEIDTPSKRGVDEAIYGLDLFYAVNGVELLSEGFLFHNEDGDGNAFYVRLSYTRDEWIPYVRFERLEVEGEDPYFTGHENGADRSQTIVGLKYDIDPITSSLKFQYRRDDSARDYDVFETQWSFHF